MRISRLKKQRSNDKNRISSRNYKSLMGTVVDHACPLFLENRSKLLGITFYLYITFNPELWKHRKKVLKCRLYNFLMGFIVLDLKLINCKNK